MCCILAPSPVDNDEKEGHNGEDDDGEGHDDEDDDDNGDEDLGPSPLCTAVAELCCTPAPSECCTVARS